MKAMAAPNRPLNEAERTDIENKIKAQWHALGEEGRRAWAQKFAAKGGRSQPRLALPGPRQQAEGPLPLSCGSSGSFSGLWQQSDHPNHLVPPSRLQGFAKARRSVNTPAGKAAGAEKLHIKEGAPKRMKEEIVEGWGHSF